MSAATKKPKSFICSYCEKTFSFHNQLVVHIRQHTGEKPFVCETCQKSFASLKVLKVHERVHTGERPYKCPYCEKCFSAYANLVVHRRIHTHEKPYQCKLCKRAFEHSGNLSRHFRAHMTDFGFRCILCSRIFEKDFELLEHTKVDHSNEYMSYTLNVNNNSSRVSNKNKTGTQNLASSSSVDNSFLSYPPATNFKRNEEKYEKFSPMNLSPSYLNSCSLNEITSTTEGIPKKWKSSKNDPAKYHIKSPQEICEAYFTSQYKEAGFPPGYQEHFLNRPQTIPDDYSLRERVVDHDSPMDLCSSGSDSRNSSSSSQDFKSKGYHRSSSFVIKEETREYDDVIYNMRKETGLNGVTSSNPPPLIPIDQVNGNYDNKSPVDLSFNVNSPRKEHSKSNFNGSYESLYSPKIETENPKFEEIPETLPESFPMQESIFPRSEDGLFTRPNEELFETPHYLKGMLQRSNVFNFYVSELKKFTFRKKVEKVLCALLGKAKLKEFGYPEKSCEQVLIRILDTINQSACADVRVDEEERFRINVRLLLEKSFPEEDSQTKLGWMGKSVDFILDQIILQEQRDRGVLIDSPTPGWQHRESLTCDLRQNNHEQRDRKLLIDSSSPGWQHRDNSM